MEHANEEFRISTFESLSQFGKELRIAVFVNVRGVKVAINVPVVVPTTLVPDQANEQVMGVDVADA
jgi:hypothetical protein